MDNVCIVISVIENLELEPNTNFRYFDWTITNQVEDVKKIIPNLDLFKKEVGAITVDAFSNKTLAYLMYELNDKETHINILHDLQNGLGGLLCLLWFFKNNAVYNSKIFSQKITDHYVGTSYRDVINSNAQGEYEKLFLSADSIEKIKDDKFMDYAKAVFTTVEEKIEPIEDLAPNINNIISGTKGRAIEIYYPYFSRIQRAFLLLQIAQKTRFLPMKIAFYTNILECLLIDQVSSELSFRLQLYTASFIGENKDEKELIRTNVNLAYNVRSKFFHGSGLKETVEKLQTLSLQMDNIIRRIMIKAINNHDIINDNKELGNYFKSIVFS
jgi:hypothetical protein